MLHTTILKERSFLVYGLGLSGISVIKFFKKNGVNNFKVWDDRNKNLFKNFRTKDLKKTLKEVDFIILSPGISLTKKRFLKKFKKKIITDIDLFYLSQKNIKSIVVTGTNGKSTTCNLIAHLFKMNRLKYSLGGNIGVPILNLKNFKNSYVIIEASSFQLSHSQFINPDFALFLNFTNDHLDWHRSMENYLNAKFKIFNLQNKNQYAIVNKKFRGKFLKRNFKSKIILPKLTKYKKIKNKINNEYLRSEINEENMSFVFTLAKIMKISNKNFLQSMISFKGLPHRFELFMKKKNVTFINDSKATSFTSTKFALSSLKNIFWILGGLPKKGDKINLLDLKDKIIKCYLIGKNTNFFIKQIKGKIDYAVTKNLQNSIIQISNDMSKIKRNKKIVLLSPASASFDQFLNFEERGNEFKKLCKKYARKFA